MNNYSKNTLSGKKEKDQTALFKEFDPIYYSNGYRLSAKMPNRQPSGCPANQQPRPQETNQEPAQETDQETNQETAQETDPLLASMETVAPSFKTFVQFSHDRIAGISSAMATVAAWEAESSSSTISAFACLI